MSDRPEERQHPYAQVVELRRYLRLAGKPDLVREYCSGCGCKLPNWEHRVYISSWPFE
jgi:hypothetical protein